MNVNVLEQTERCQLRCAAGARRWVPACPSQPFGGASRGGSKHSSASCPPAVAGWFLGSSALGLGPAQGRASSSLVLDLQPPWKPEWRAERWCYCQTCLFAEQALSFVNKCPWFSILLTPKLDFLDEMLMCSVLLLCFAAVGLFLPGGHPTASCLPESLCGR